jgi:hypothetical protein
VDRSCSNEDELFLLIALVGRAAHRRRSGRTASPEGDRLARVQSFLIGAALLTDQVARSLPGSTFEAFSADSQGYLVPMLLIGPLILLLFPDGRPPSRRWNFVPWLFAISMVTGAIGLGLAPEESVPWSRWHPRLRRPLGSLESGVLRWRSPP